MKDDSMTRLLSWVKYVNLFVNLNQFLPKIIQLLVYNVQNITSPFVFAGKIIILSSNSVHPERDEYNKTEAESAKDTIDIFLYVHSQSQSHKLGAKTRNCQ